MAAIDRTLAQRLASDQLPSSRLLSAEKRGLQRKLVTRRGTGALTSSVSPTSGNGSTPGFSTWSDGKQA